MQENDDFDLETFLPYLLNQAAETSGLEFQRLYKDRYGLLRTEWRVLFHLGMYGRMTAKEIGLRARVHKTKISRAVHSLVQRRFLTRNRDEHDRRMEHLELTKAGRAAYRDLRAAAQAYDENLLSRFSPEEADQLKRLLGILAASGSHGRRIQAVGP